jgi:hypothetical protein
MQSEASAHPHPAPQTIKAPVSTKVRLSEMHGKDDEKTKAWLRHRMDL